MMSASVFRRALAAMALWMCLCVGITIAVAGASPHGMAAFVGCGAVLAVVGGCGQFVAAFRSARATLRGHDGLRVTVLGLMYGVAAFFLAMLAYEHALHLPHDAFQLALVAYLLIVATTINHAVRWVFRRVAICV